MGKKKPVISFNSNSITEGESLITTLTNLKPKKKFFYALTGDGVDKSDLDSGKIKGRLKASKQGTAVLSHIFSEDNFYEGTETFTFSIFKDKKNRKLLGESQEISIKELSNSDTNDGNKESTTKMNGAKINGFYPDTIISDKTYGIDSKPVKNYFYLVDSSALENFSEHDTEVEFGENFIATTYKSIHKDSTKGFGRTVYQGEFDYNNGEITSARVDRFAQVGLNNKSYGWGLVRDLGVTVPQPDSFWSWQSTLNTGINQGELVAEYDIGMETPEEITGDYGSVVSYGNGRFFYDGWENNPFGQDLI